MVLMGFEKSESRIQEIIRTPLSYDIGKVVIKKAGSYLYLALNEKHGNKLLFVRVDRSCKETRSYELNTKDVGTDFLNTDFFFDFTVVNNIALIGTCVIKGREIDLYIINFLEIKSVQRETFFKVSGGPISFFGLGEPIEGTKEVRLIYGSGGVRFMERYIQLGGEENREIEILEKKEEYNFPYMKYSKIDKVNIRGDFIHFNGDFKLANGVLSKEKNTNFFRTKSLYYKTGDKYMYFAGEESSSDLDLQGLVSIEKSGEKEIHSFDFNEKNKEFLLSKIGIFYLHVKDKQKLKELDYDPMSLGITIHEARESQAFEIYIKKDTGENNNLMLIFCGVICLMFSCFILGVYYFSVINLEKRKKRYLEL